MWTRRQRVQPGFTKEELDYLEETLAWIEGQAETSFEDGSIDDTSSYSTSPAPSSLAASVSDMRHPQHHSSRVSRRKTHRPTFFPTVPLLPSLSEFLETRILSGQLFTKGAKWIRTHPATIGILFVFVANTLLLSVGGSSWFSIRAVVGLALLILGLRLLVGAETLNEELTGTPERVGRSLKQRPLESLSTRGSRRGSVKANPVVVVADDQDSP